MFDGKRFFPVTGMPMRKIACMSNAFALAEPVPITVPILNAKSLTRVECRGSRVELGSSDIVHRLRHNSSQQPLAPHPPTIDPARVWQHELELPHVPRGGRASLGAEATVQTDVFVFHHDPLRLRQRIRREDLLLRVYRRRRECQA